jgi:8-oxo-dGTP pyrophosphatase MutT (NUDIX family)
MSPDPVEVRSAATVLMLRSGANDGPATLYMVRRSSRSPFMPDAMVFPGGAVDEGDGDPGHDDSFLRAARRESREEAEVDLGGRGLRWFDTWQTPRAESRRRFLARFYLARLEPDEGHDARPDGHETTSGRWGTPEDFLSMWSGGEIDLPVPTLCVLLMLRAHGPTHFESRPQPELRTPILPRIKLPNAGEGGRENARGDGVMVVLPHDPEYPDLPGEPCALPERARELPPRFLREGNRWKPC